MVPDPEPLAGWTFADFCLWVYVLVDEVWPRIAPALHRPGPPPACADQELVAMLLIGECCGWDRETEFASRWAAHRALFPRQPERSRLNRRRRQLQDAVNEARRLLLAGLDLAQLPGCVLDSLPVPVLAFARSRRARRVEWQTHGAAFGRVPSKGETIFGYRLYLLVTRDGVIRDFVLAPANLAEVAVGGALLEAQAGLEVLGDKAFVSAPLQRRLREERGVALLTLPRRNQTRRVSAAGRRAFAALRRVVETVNSQLAVQFKLQVNHARTFAGLAARLHSKLAAHTVCLCLNRRLGRPDVLQIKDLAFPPPN
jgi:IS5 family transposase